METEDVQLGTVTHRSRHTDGLQSTGQQGGQECVKRGWWKIVAQSLQITIRALHLWTIRVEEQCHVSQCRQAEAASSLSNS